MNNATKPTLSSNFIASIVLIALVAVMGSVHGCIAEHQRPFEEIRITAAALTR